MLIQRVNINNLKYRNPDYNSKSYMNNYIYLVSTKY